MPFVAMEGSFSVITRRVDRFLTATTADLFNNTDLRQAPGPGAIAIWAASDQNDGTINVRIGGISYKPTLSLIVGPMHPSRRTRTLPLLSLLLGAESLSTSTTRRSRPRTHASSQSGLAFEHFQQHNRR